MLSGPYLAHVMSHILVASLQLFGQQGVYALRRQRF
jgi:hypothetical protein